MNKALLLTIAHWVINVFLIAAGLLCLYLALFHRETSAFNRGMTFLVGVLFLGFAGVFIWYTAKRG